MPCLLGCLALFTPRLVVLLLWLFTNFMNRAYAGAAIWAVLGFLFLPVTTLAYAWAINAHGSIDGLWIVLLIVTVMVDLGLVGGGARSRRYRNTRIRT